MGEVHIDDLYYLSREIEKRQIESWIMQLDIASSSFDGRTTKAFRDVLNRERDKIGGVEQLLKPPKLDKDHLQSLKNRLNSESLFIRVQ